MRLKFEDKKYYILTIQQLFNRLDGKLINLNHVGINFGPAVLPWPVYLGFKKLIAQRCNLYKYPTGEEWPFIIPATGKEFLEDITDETIKRNPKFEFVYYKYQRKPLIQVDIETKLTKNETLKLFPSPYGVSFDGLKEFFRTVFVMTDWPGVILRLDLRFRSVSKGLAAGRDHGYWMIKKGGRIR
jgi:hypothetical protein